MLDLTMWVEDAYGSETYHLIDHVRESYFEGIRQQYIGTGVFANVFLIFPDMCAKWWVWDVLSGYRASIAYTDEQIFSDQYPYNISKDVYDQIKNQQLPEEQ